MHDRIEPSRLTLARRLAGATKASLAKELAVSPGTVVLWEDGKRDPTSRIERLAEILRVTPAFLCGDEVPTTEPDSLSFRKRQDAGRLIRDKAAATIDVAAGILTPAVKGVFDKERWPRPDVPQMSLGPEDAAEALREHWNLGKQPIRNVVSHLEAKGVRMYWLSSTDKSLSAFCRYVNEEPYIVLNTSRKDGCRSRYDACHELGHLVLHRDVDFATADIRAIERDADTFASAFLMPRETFQESAPSVFDVDRLLALKSIWGTSVQAMVRRLKDIGVFRDWQYTSAYKWMSAKGWRRSAEPLAGLIESSAIHWQLCDRLEHDDTDPATFIRSVELSTEVAFELMPVLGVRQSSLSFKYLFEERPLFEEPLFD